MTRTRRIALAWILLSSGISIFWGANLEQQASGGMVDFKAVYYGAQCVIHHSDPYKESEFLGVYRAAGGQFPREPALARLFYRAVPLCVNLPTSLFVTAPLAMLAWGPAHALWMLLLAGSFTLAAFLAWDLGASYAPGVSLLLVCMVAVNSEVLFLDGNLAGIAVSLCVAAVWCFLKERFLLVGIACLGVSLAIKPHDAGLVWLYFLLAGGAGRKRALQALVVTVVLSVPAVLWVARVSPQWLPELNSNLMATSARGDLSDPGPASMSIGNPDRIIDLQTVVSVFRDDPRIYNPVSYLVCGALLLGWSVRTVRSRFSAEGGWLALAAVAALSLLPIYHRQYDAKLLLLTVPACAMLWAEGGAIRWVALLLNTAGLAATGDIPSAVLTLLYNHLHRGTAGIFDQILTVALMRAAPLTLLAMGAFYLWVYLRRDRGRVAMAEPGESSRTPHASTTAQF